MGYWRALADALRHADDPSSVAVLARHHDVEDEVLAVVRDASGRNQRLSPGVPVALLAREELSDAGLQLAVTLAQGNEEATLRRAAVNRSISNDRFAAFAKALGFQPAASSTLPVYLAAGARYAAIDLSDAEPAIARRALCRVAAAGDEDALEDLLEKYPDAVPDDATWLAIAEAAMQHPRTGAGIALKAVDSVSDQKRVIQHVALMLLTCVPLHVDVAVRVTKHPVWVKAEQEPLFGHNDAGTDPIDALRPFTSHWRTYRVASDSVPEQCEAAIAAIELCKGLHTRANGVLRSVLVGAGPHGLERAVSTYLRQHFALAVGNEPDESVRDIAAALMECMPKRLFLLGGLQPDTARDYGKWLGALVSDTEDADVDDFARVLLKHASSHSHVAAAFLESSAGRKAVKRNAAIAREVFETAVGLNIEPLLQWCVDAGITATTVASGYDDWVLTPAPGMKPKYRDPLYAGASAGALPDSSPARLAFDRERLADGDAPATEEEVRSRFLLPPRSTAALDVAIESPVCVASCLGLGLPPSLEDALTAEKSPVKSVHVVVRTGSEPGVRYSAPSPDAVTVEWTAAMSAAAAQGLDGRFAPSMNPPLPPPPLSAA